MRWPKKWRNPADASGKAMISHRSEVKPSTRHLG
jgi:hypothetical protein